MNLPLCPIPAGSYRIGDDQRPISRPEHTVALGAYSIMRTTVTNADFLGFVAAKGYTEESLWSEMGWRWLQGKPVTQPHYFGDPSFNRPEQPVVGVCWYEAQAFARWISRETGQEWRLPTEAEWEAAVRGPEDQPPDARTGNTAERGPSYAWAVTKVGNTAWCGAEDLLGNVWEWCSSRWGRNWQTLEYPYPYQTGDGREDPEGSHARIMRGGSWFDPVWEAQPANRGRYLPGSRASNIGFRLVVGNRD
ncbi:MAG: SUMF1/EgtB/PvdO family nonheme iron enzyme [Anaerolineae bacterium]|nr:SUMF1/EgtB/PvdO family nonheme iron enzyme [Anaerolineae bacterium]